MSSRDCPVDHYKVTTDIACATPITDLTRFKITGDLLEIGLGTPIVETTVYLCAFNSIESALMTKSGAMKIEICGYETITLATAGALSYDYDMTTQLNPTAFDVEAMFVNAATNCPITSYHLVNVTGVAFSAATNILPAWKDNFNLGKNALNKTTLNVTMNRPGQYRLYVMAATDSMVVAFKEFNFNMTLQCKIIP